MEHVGQGIGATPLKYVYFSTGVLEAALPGMGPAAGNVEMEVVGWGLAAVAECMFSGVRGTACQLPAGGVGFVEVGVEGAEAAVGSPAVVGYHSMPQVMGVIPKTGRTGGGTVTHVQGRGLVEAWASCVYGNTAVGAAFVSSALLTCESPSRIAASMVTVEVSAGAGIESGSEMAFTYTLAEHVTLVKPGSGPLEGGNVVSVHGNNFVGSGLTACKMGSIGPVEARAHGAELLDMIPAKWKGSETAAPNGKN